MSTNCNWYVISQKGSNIRHAVEIPLLAYLYTDIAGYEITGY